MNCIFASTYYLFDSRFTGKIAAVRVSQGGGAIRRRTQLGIALILFVFGESLFWYRANVYRLDFNQFQITDSVSIALD